MTYVRLEKPQAVEHLVFQVKPERLDEWLELDHEHGVGCHTISECHVPQAPG
jgi:hypothetical protein